MLVGFGSEVLLGSLDEADDVGEGTDGVLGREGGRGLQFSV